MTIISHMAKTADISKLHNANGSAHISSEPESISPTTLNGSIGANDFATQASPTTHKSSHGLFNDHRDDHGHEGDDAFVPNHPRRNSTMETNASVGSASFEDTAVWDQKAILSLGTPCPFTS